MCIFVEMMEVGMPVDAFFFNTQDGWAQRESHTWTDDFSFAAPSTIYATATVTGMETTNDSSMWSGIWF